MSTWLPSKTTTTTYNNNNSNSNNNNSNYGLSTWLQMELPDSL